MHRIHLPLGSMRLVYGKLVYVSKRLRLEGIPLGYIFVPQTWVCMFDSWKGFFNKSFKWWVFSWWCSIPWVPSFPFKENHQQKIKSNPMVYEIYIYNPHITGAQRISSPSSTLNNQLFVHCKSKAVSWKKLHLRQFVYTQSWWWLDFAELQWCPA